MALDAVGQCRDVGGLVVVVVDEPELRDPAPAAQFGRDGIENRRRRRGRVLRIQRQHQYAPHALVAELFQRRTDRRAAITHTEHDGYLAAEAPFQRRLERLALAYRDLHQRRPAIRPYLLIRLRRAPGPGVEDDAVEHEPPRQPRYLDDARVPQELFQVTAHRGAVRGIRRAQVDKQYAHLCGLVMMEGLQVRLAHDLSIRCASGARFLEWSDGLDGDVDATRAV